MSILEERIPIEYEGITYPSFFHALYANTTSYADIKWYLIHSDHDRAVDIIRSNFSFCFSNDEVEKHRILIRLLTIRNKDPEFKKRIHESEDEFDKEIAGYLKNLTDIEV